MDDKGRAFWRRILFGEPPPGGREARVLHFTSSVPRDRVLRALHMFLATYKAFFHQEGVRGI
jgi:hypothetical protein